VACKAVDMAISASRRRFGLVASCVVAAPVLLVILAQAILPTLAAHRVRGRVARYGSVKSVSVKAFPAIELLWGRADSVEVHAGALSVPSGEIAKLLWEAHGVTDATMSAQAATVTAIPSLAKGITVSDLHTEKRGAAIVARASLTQRQLDEALPSGFRIEPVASGNGQIEAKASGGLFGLQASIDAVVRASEGRLVTEPKGLPFGGFVTVTLFSDPHLKVESVGLSIERSDPLTYALSLRARLA
jgi:hypothetical protein